MQSSDVSSSFIAVLSSLAIQSPLLILYLAGIVIALIRWARHPRTSLFTILALGVLLVLAITNTFVYTLLPTYFFGGEQTLSQRFTIFYLIGIIINLLHATAFGFLLAAIFGERTNKSNV